MRSAHPPPAFPKDDQHTPPAIGSSARKSRLYYNTSLYVIRERAPLMPLTVRLPPRVEEELKAYCVARRISKSDAVKAALERLLSETGNHATPYELGSDGFGADDSQ